MTRKNSPMAPYFVQMREFERRLMTGAIETAGGNIAAAAQMLGVTQHYVRARAKLLGGVIGNEPKHEPPGRAINAWNATNGIGMRGRNGVDEDEPAPDVEISDEVVQALTADE